MSPEAQRIAIAEACGWSNLQYSDYKPLGKAQLVGKHPGGSAQNLLLVPDYLNDLNAMHEAEKVLTQAQDYQYRDSVLPAVCKDGSGMIALTATAAQRAEAFLRTIGKWEEASK